MMKTKLAGYLEAVGLTVVVISSFAWILHLQWIVYVYFVGTLLFAIGRLAVQQKIKNDSITVKRLLRQRTFAVFVLLFSAMLMFTEPGWYFGYNLYITSFSWFVPFLVFVVIEVYTTFRLSSVLKKC